MARCLAFFFAALVAVSQAAPRPQQVDAGTQQTNPNPGAGGAGSTPNTGGSDSSSNALGAPGSIAIIIPAEIANSFLTAAGVGGTSTTGTSGTNGNSGFSDTSPLAAIISLIGTERNRFGQAVQQLVQGNVAAITDSIEGAATTGGKLLSNGVKLAGTWPAFFGQWLG